MYNPFDHYFTKAKKEGYKARSAFKLEAIQDKFCIFDKNVHTVIDIGCAPGSRLQYASKELQNKAESSPRSTAGQGKQKAMPTSRQAESLAHDDYLIIGFDIKEVKISLPHVYTYKQDITDRVGVQKILDSHHIQQADCIISDMAPNTIWFKDIDAIRAFDLLEQSLWMYEILLKPTGKFVTKVFMWPGFDQYVKRMKDVFGGKNIKIYKPDASRTQSKETYVIKI